MTRYIGTGFGWLDLATGAVAGASEQSPAPTNVNPPFVQTAKVGEPLSLKYGTWSGGSGFTTRALLAGVQVSETYVPVSGDAGKAVVFEVTRLNPTGPSTTVTSEAVTVTAAAVVTGTSLFAGHVPNRVLAGMAVSSNARPANDEALELIGQSVYERRIFVGASFNLTDLNQMLAKCDGWNALPWVSFKANPFGQIASGSLDAGLTMVRNRAKLRRTEGPGGTPMPFVITANHEPVNDGDLSVWAKDHIYASNFLAGWTTNANGTKGTYTAANDVSDICAWSSIHNGFLWKSPMTRLTDINNGYPQLLIDTFRENRSVLAVDTYDVEPANGYQPTATGGGTYGTNEGARTWTGMRGFIDWSRARNCGALGLGEWGCNTLAGLEECWKVCRENRDLVAIMNFFNSYVNSTTDPRLIPIDYPAYNGGPNSKGLYDQGGNIWTQTKLDWYRGMLDQSRSATYTGPIGA